MDKVYGRLGDVGVEGEIAFNVDGTGLWHHLRFCVVKKLPKERTWHLGRRWITRHAGPGIRESCLGLGLLKRWES